MIFAPARLIAAPLRFSAVVLFLAAASAAAQEDAPRLAQGEPIPPAELEAPPG